MRKLIAWAFMYSLDGLLADEGTEYWQFCFGLPVLSRLLSDAHALPIACRCSGVSAGRWCAPALMRLA
jgi:hypothetical protein